MTTKTLFIDLSSVSFEIDTLDNLVIQNETIVPSGLWEHIGDQCFKVVLDQVQEGILYDLVMHQYDAQKQIASYAKECSSQYFNDVEIELEFY